MHIAYIESSRKGTGRISLVQVAPRFGSLELRWTGSSGDFFPQDMNRRKRINASLLRPECILTKKHLFCFFILFLVLSNVGGSFQNGFYEWVEEARIQKREYRGRNYSGDRFFAGRHGTTMRLFINVLWNSEMCEILGDLRLANKFQWFYQFTFLSKPWWRDSRIVCRTIHRQGMNKHRSWEINEWWVNLSG